MPEWYAASAGVPMEIDTAALGLSAERAEQLRTLLAGR